MIKLMNIDQETIKVTNKKKILKLLYKKRKLTKQDISKELNISIPTAISNINELIKEGIVTEAGVADSTGGRKPVIVEFLANSRYSIGVKISTNSIRVILVNLDSQIQFDKIYEVSNIDKFDDIFNFLKENIENIIEDKNISKEKILGIGFSLPGTVNEEEMILEVAPNLKIKNISFKKFASMINIPVYIENEANAAAYAELNLGIAKEFRNLVYVSITEGIGVGVVIQDNLYKGKNKRAGEFGHMTIVPDGIKCNCGRRGCWEMYASEKALLENYSKSKGKKITSLDELFINLDNKEKNAKDVWSEYIKYLSIGIQNIILILDPHYVIIGGCISKYGKKVLDALDSNVFVKNDFYNKGDNKILLSILKDDSCIQGAALLPIRKLFFLQDKII